MNTAESNGICIDTANLVGETGDMILLNPGKLHTLVTTIRSKTENGAPFLATEEIILRSARHLSKGISGWSFSQVDFRHEDYPDAHIMWFGLEERSNITSFSFVMGHDDKPDIMELATMDLSGGLTNPITYLSGVPCTEPNEAVKIITPLTPSEEQLRSLAELAIIPEVPDVIQSMLIDVGRRTHFNALRIVSSECSEEGLPILRLTSPKMAFYTPLSDRQVDKKHFDPVV